MSAPEISVIVPARNAAHEIIAFLDAVLGQDLDAARYEVLVIDDASTDDTAAIVEADGRARLLHTPHWGGAYFARNVGIAEAGGDLFAFTDADCRPYAGWLTGALAAFAQSGADLVAGHIEVPLAARPSGVEIVDFARNLDQERAVAEGGFGATANLIVPRAVIDAVGTFNDSLIGSGDQDLCHRAAAAGHRLVYAPEAIVRHPPRTTAYGLMRRSFRDGFDRTQRIRHASRETESRIWTGLGWWVPSALVGRRRIVGFERLDREGIALTRRQRLAAAVAEYGCIQLPAIAGSLASTVGEGWWRRKRTSR
jgi:glycosyltransferase involved in cell wall biosynthesis